MSAAQPLLTYAYTTAARQTGALLIPVGDVWQLALRWYKQIRLYQADDSHPAQSGSFLTAVSILQVLLLTVKLVVGYPIVGLPVDSGGQIMDISFHRSAPRQCTLYPSTNQIVLISLPKWEQEALLSVGRQVTYLAVLC